MTAVSRGPVTALLLRAGIIAGILAIVAGIFGMHVMTGNHTAHSPAVASSPAGAGGAHTDHQPADDHSAVETSAFQGELSAVPEACTCSGDCTSFQSMGAACVPSAKTGTLSAPQPGTLGLAFDAGNGLPSTVSASYTYLPGSPSPGELSISRT